VAEFGLQVVQVVNLHMVFTLLDGQCTCMWLE
jgi:hypothetical protein